MITQVVELGIMDTTATTAAIAMTTTKAAIDKRIDQSAARVLWVRMATIVECPRPATSGRWRGPGVRHFTRP
jgi:hypothetical protein